MADTLPGAFTGDGGDARLGVFAGTGPDAGLAALTAVGLLVFGWVPFAAAGAGAGLEAFCGAWVGFTACVIVGTGKVGVFKGAFAAGFVGQLCGVGMDVSHGACAWGGLVEDAAAPAVEVGSLHSKMREAVQLLVLGCLIHIAGKVQQERASVIHPAGWPQICFATHLALSFYKHIWTPSCKF